MRFFILLVITILAVITQSVIAQDYTFRVLANKGNNQLKKAGEAGAINLKAGINLFPGDQIIAVTDAYIGLVHSSGKTIEIKTAGTHNVDDLDGTLDGSTRVAGMYLNRTMNKKDEGNINNNQQEKEGTRSISADIRMYLKDRSKVFGTKATIRWDSEQQSSGYIVTVNNLFGQILLRNETSDTRLDLDFNHPRLANERYVKVIVTSKENENFKSGEFFIERIPPNESKAIQKQFEELRNELPGESSLNKLIIASFFAENNLYLDALTSYEEAVDLSPDVEDFKSIYEAFVAENGLGN